MMLMLPLLGDRAGGAAQAQQQLARHLRRIVMVVTYHKINQYAESAGARRMVPELALWLPFLAFVALILWMYHVIAHRRGQPIGALGPLSPSSARWCARWRRSGL